ncbi:hypothetical protein AWB78_08482 [Caballeronia calidae]|uniref:Uncharacterized protein n=2 Tax=Caballeronia calidae TaxID=1777139 RepID=A0A158EK90_9BURK|nr:hypothetical protein AWB78_08482 [Caballeronia calidae]
MMRPTVDELMRRAFDAPRDPTSPEYKAGVRSILNLRVGGIPVPLPYELGTAQADAYFAGQNEGHRIWRKLEEEGEV